MKGYDWMNLNMNIGNASVPQMEAAAQQTALPATFQSMPFAASTPPNCYVSV